MHVTNSQVLTVTEHYRKKSSQFKTVCKDDSA